MDIEGQRNTCIAYW